MKKYAKHVVDNNSDLNLKSIEAILSYQRKFLNFLKFKVGNAEVAEDIFQSSFLKALKSRDSLNNEESIIPWFTKF